MNLILMHLKKNNFRRMPEVDERHDYIENLLLENSDENKTQPISYSKKQQKKVVTF